MFDSAPAAEHHEGATDRLCGVGGEDRRMLIGLAHPPHIEFLSRVYLPQEFKADHAGSYAWEYLNRQLRDWRIRIARLASTPLPRLLVHQRRQALVVDTSRASASE